jgi:hypothetical protein
MVSMSVSGLTLQHMTHSIRVEVRHDELRQETFLPATTTRWRRKEQEEGEALRKYLEARAVRGTVWGSVRAKAAAVPSLDQSQRHAYDGV